LFYTEVQSKILQMLACLGNEVHELRQQQDHKSAALFTNARDSRGETQQCWASEFTVRL